jgi:hypothetical protein
MSKTRVLENYLENPDEYKVLSPILNDILVLHDTIQSQASRKHTESGGRGGKLAFVIKKKKGSQFDFPFIAKKGDQQLHRAALLPMLAAFRWMVKRNPETRLVEWDGGFQPVLKLWEQAAADLMSATQATSEENRRKVHAIGRSKNHWVTLHSTVMKYKFTMASQR